MVHPVSTVIAILVLLTQLDLIIAAVWSLTKYRSVCINAIKDNALLLGFIISLGATLGSLFYSDFLGFEPCKLCWFQRILMYPQVVLFAMALWNRRSGDDRSVLPYSFVLSILGAGTALYHYLLQFGAVSGSNCAVYGQGAACSGMWVLEFGYITIPMMALTAFVAIAVGSGVGHFSKK